MIFATINDNTRLFDTWQEFHKTTCCPASVVEFVTDFHIKGRTYEARKASARELIQGIWANDCGGLSWGEYALICDYVQKIGKRYGLTEELHANGIL